MELRIPVSEIQGREWPDLLLRWGSAHSPPDVLIRDPEIGELPGMADFKEFLRYSESKRTY